MLTMMIGRRRALDAHIRTRLRGVLLVGLLAAGACAHTQPDTARLSRAATLRVLTYNIFGGHDLERRSNLARVAALIDSLDADVVFLQEVDRNTARSGRVDQADTLARLTGMRAVFARALDFDGGEYGIALLSRRPVQHSRVVPLEFSLPDSLMPPNTEPRVLLHAVIETAGGAVHLVNTHVDHRGHTAARHPQLLRLLGFIADSIPRDASIVLGGDFNATPDAVEIRALGAAFTDSWRACGIGDENTFRADAPARRIDYVFLANATCSSARVLSSTASDHRPVLVEVRIPPAGR
jgi:endonuclease/exonuclease/phosphatase family metal-dependent hydrolase